MFSLISKWFGKWEAEQPPPGPPVRSRREVGLNPELDHVTKRIKLAQETRRKAKLKVLEESDKLQEAEDELQRAMSKFKQHLQVWDTARTSHKPNLKGLTYELHSLGLIVEMDAHGLCMAEYWKARAEIDVNIASAEARAETATTQQLKECYEEQIITEYDASFALVVPPPFKVSEAEEKLRLTYPARYLIPLEFGKDVVLRAMPSYILPYVDDDGRIDKVVGEIDDLIASAKEGHLGKSRVPLITGPSGYGKSRLAREAAVSFVRAKPERRFAEISLDSDQEHLRPFVAIDEDQDNYRLLAAALLLGLFDMFCPEWYRFEWNDAQDFILARLPRGVTVIALVIDEFGLDIPLARHLFWGCLNTLTNATKIKVVPIFAGIHRTRAPSDMHDLLGLEQRGHTSRQAGLSVIELSNLSAEAVRKFVRNMANAWGVSHNDLIKPEALGSIIDSCGGSPLFLMVTFIESKEVLEEIKVNKAVGSHAGTRLWHELNARLVTRCSSTKFALVISESDSTFMPEPYARYDMPQCLQPIVSIIMERLVLLAMTRVPVDFASPVLRRSELDSLRSSDSGIVYYQNVRNFTFQKAKRMFDIIPLVEDNNFGRVTIPLLAVSACCEFLTSMKLQRSLLNPFTTTPTLLGSLVIESLSNMFNAHIHIGRSDLDVDKLRPGNRHWGRHVTLRLPSSCSVVNPPHLAIQWKEGLLFRAAVDQSTMDGGGIFKEQGSDLWAIVISQSKFPMDCLPQMNDNGDTVTIGKTDASRMLEGMRKYAVWIKSELGLKPDDPVLCIYDMLTTRATGAQFPHNDPDLFSLEPNEVVLLTTKDSIRDALGPVLGLRLSFSDA